jgi:hypothetical protein
MHLGIPTLSNRLRYATTFHGVKLESALVPQKLREIPRFTRVVSATAVQLDAVGGTPKCSLHRTAKAD